MTTLAPLPLHLDRLRHFAWPGLACILPPEWEITAYRLGGDAGRLNLHRQEQPVAQCTWRRCPRPPDLRATLAEIANRGDGKAPTGKGSTPASPNPDAHPGPAGFLLADSLNGGLQAIRFDTASAILLHWIFPNATLAAVSSEVEALLSSYAANHGSHQSWALFGLRLELPKEFIYTRLKPQAACVALECTHANGLHIKAWRLALADAILGSSGGYAGVLRQLLRSDGAHGIGAGDHTVRGLSGARAAFVRPARRGIESIFARWHTGEAWLWHDATEGRLYAFEQWGPRRAPRLDPGVCGWKVNNP